MADSSHQDDPLPSQSKRRRADYDIDKQRLAARYTRALMNVAHEQGESQQVVDELDLIVDELLDRFPELEQLLAAPRVSHEAKSRLLDEVLSGHVSELLVTFLKVVGRHGRLDCLRQMRTAARDELYRRSGRVLVELVSAEPLSQEQLSEIAACLRPVLNAEPDLRPRVDPKVLGGLLIRAGDTVFDSTIADRLRRLRRFASQRVAQRIRQDLDRFATSG